MVKGESFECLLTFTFDYAFVSILAREVDYCSVRQQHTYIVCCLLPRFIIIEAQANLFEELPNLRDGLSNVLTCC
ncbi:hypothetical protein D3C79_922850 [compost metagenome]